MWSFRNVGVSLVGLLFVLSALSCSGDAGGVAPVTRPQMSLRLTPMFAFEGNAVRATCFHPDVKPHNRIRLAIEGMKVVDKEQERMVESLLIESAECGTWDVTCTVYDPRQGGRTERRELTLVVKGRCNDGQKDPHIYGHKWNFPTRKVAR